jgi:hypothetical protein
MEEIPKSQHHHPTKPPPSPSSSIPSLITEPNISGDRVDCDHPQPVELKLQVQKPSTPKPSTKCPSDEQRNNLEGVHHHQRRSSSASPFPPCKLLSALDCPEVFDPILCYSSKRKFYMQTEQVMSQLFATDKLFEAFVVTQHDIDDCPGFHKLYHGGSPDCKTWIARKHKWRSRAFRVNSAIMLCSWKRKRCSHIFGASSHGMMCLQRDPGNTWRSRKHKWRSRIARRSVSSRSSSFEEEGTDVGQVPPTS